MENWPGVVEKYKEFMPVKEDTEPVTLREGNTPLIHAKKISEELGVELYMKYDGANPTGSFKDRGMTMAVTNAVEEGSKAIMCASTGNTSAAAAAYELKVI